MLEKFLNAAVTNKGEVKFALSIIAFVITFSCGVGTIDYLIKSNEKRKNNINASGHVFLLTPSGKINLGDYVGEYSADKNQTVWMDKNGSKHMTTAAVEFIESKK